MRRIFLLLATLALLISPALPASITSNQSSATPSAVAQEKRDGSSAWRNPNNGLKDDGLFATSSVVQGMYSSILRFTDFGFSIPDNATIEGIVVRIKKQAEASSISDGMVKLIKRGAIVGQNKCHCSEGWPVIASEYRIHGGPMDPWGLDLGGSNITPADVNRNDFGVAILAYNTEGEYTQREAGIDAVEITVYFSLPQISRQVYKQSQAPKARYSLHRIINSSADVIDSIAPSAMLWHQSASFLSRWSNYSASAL